MERIKPGVAAHPTESELADYLGNGLPEEERERLTDHIGSCADCLVKLTAAYEAVSECDEAGKTKKRGYGPMKKTDLYCIGAVIAFILSFLMPRFFLQFLVATLILGLKWIVDSKSARMLIMIHEAWKSGREKEASKTLERFGNGPAKRG